LKQDKKALKKLDSVFVVFTVFMAHHEVTSQAQAFRQSCPYFLVKLLLLGIID
jgi:hypothetical protein